MQILKALSMLNLLSKKWIIISAAVLLFIAFLVWLFIESSKPLPGQKIADLGRGHVDIGKEIEYNSNPPTSGPHYPDWVRTGIYDTGRDDRNLVHSLEHGYIIMHYKCTTSVENKEIATSSAAPRNDDEKGCNQRKDQLAKIYEKKGKHKLIVVPRSNLDTNFALTAWDYLDRFDSFDQARIEKFIDAHRDQGPERTME